MSPKELEDLRGQGLCSLALATNQEEVDAALALIDKYEKEVNGNE